MIGTLLLSHGSQGMDAQLFEWAHRMANTLWSLKADERVYLPGRGEQA